MKRSNSLNIYRTRNCCRGLWVRIASFLSMLQRIITFAVWSCYSTFKKTSHTDDGNRIEAIFVAVGSLLWGYDSGIFGTAQAQEYFQTFFHPETPILGAIISTVCESKTV
jgi:hypothetical protein